MAIRSEELMELDLDDFLSIVSDDFLNVRHERLVWECCVRWIDHDPEKRTCHLMKLMSGIRFGLMSRDVSFFLKFYS